jgi:hypothetical protein
VDAIPTESDLIEWIRHLSEKTWMDKELLNEFAQAVERFRWLDYMARGAA